MCGIFFSTNFNINTQTIDLIKNRGKDHFCLNKTDHFIYGSSVLHIRSEIKQPISEDEIVLYNGEIYNNEKSDTLFINHLVKEALKINCDCIKTESIEKYENNRWNIDHEIFVCFCKASFVYEKITEESELALLFVHQKEVYFFKDCLGRKSLGFKHDEHFTISSIQQENEIDPHYLYKYDIQNSVLYRIKKQELLLENNIRSDTDTVYNSLLKSIKKRLHPYNNVILFSGGIDSLLIAVLLHKSISKLLPIYLINTMFITKNESIDRINGRKSYTELLSNFPNRKFIFIENDISQKELDDYKIHIKQLIFPKTSQMDYNIGACLFFGAKKAKEYSKVLFTGGGADELFCGYKNHHNETDLLKRIKYDIENIWERNLGRDDRVMSDNNIEPRYPFLDTELIKKVYNLPKELFINNCNGISENKVVLRQILKQCGFDNGCSLKKTAMQFGSGICKYEKNNLRT